MELISVKKRVVISADSTCDLLPEMLERFDIKVIPLTVQLGEDVYLDGVSFTTDMLFDRYAKDKALPKTSAPSLQQYMDYFAQYVNEGCEVVHFSISSELSSAFQTATLAAEELGSVYTIDSRELSNGIALFAMEAADCRDKGMSAAEIVAHVMPMIGTEDVSIIIDTLEFMWKGGRCSSVTALGANLLMLKPAMEMRGGKLCIFKKYRGKLSSAYTQYIQERLSGKHIRNGYVFLTQSGGIDEALIAELDKLIYSVSDKVEILHSRTGCTVSSHCGPRTLGLGFFTE